MLDYASLPNKERWMTLIHRALICTLPASALALALLLSGTSFTASPGGRNSEKPVRLEAVPGSSVKRIILTEKARKRIDIETGVIAKDDADRPIVLYQALIYDAHGQAWVYEAVDNLSFIRHKVSVAAVSGGQAVLIEGPPDGTRVVIRGVAELLGAESGVGH